MAGKLDAKVAIITGASLGIGAATAIALAEEGAQVAITARRIERLNEVAQKIEPGLVATEFIDSITDPAAKQGIEARFKAVTPLQPEDIARAIAYAVTQPPHVNVNEILIRPTQQE